MTQPHGLGSLRLLRDEDNNKSKRQKWRNSRRNVLSSLILCILSFSVQIQKRSGAWFYKGQDQQLLPSPLPLSRPPQSRSPDPRGHAGSGSPPTSAQLRGSLLKTRAGSDLHVTAGEVSVRSSCCRRADVLSPQSRSSSRRRRSAQNNRNRQQEQQLTRPSRPRQLS